MAAKSKKKKVANRLMNNDTMSGFTIIEVVLVLAIGGLIFMMVFLAFPQLQRAQRDSQRERDMASLAQAVLNYQGNNNGKLPGMDAKGALSTAAVLDATVDLSIDVLDNQCTTANSRNTGAAACLVRRYLNAVDATENTWVDPDGWAYGLTIDNLANVGDPFEVTPQHYEDKMAFLLYGAVCDGEMATGSNNPRDFVIMYKLEGNGSLCR